MKYSKHLLVSCLCFITFCASASAQTLNLSRVALPCTSYQALVELPLTLTNAAGISIAAVSADITFDDTYFIYDSVRIGAAGTAASKIIEGTELTPGTVRIGVYGQSNTTVIADGIVGYVRFKLLINPADGIALGITPGASDPAGNPVTITGNATGGFYTVKTGDTNKDGTVSIAEIIACVGMFLGATVDPICDPSGDGIVQINEVVKAINCALETPSCACDVSPTGPREETEWKGSGHADATSMAFNDWNAAGTVPAGCTKCHTSTGYVNYVTNPAAPAVGVTIGETITCKACHDSAAEALTSVAFEASGSAIAPVVTKVTVTGLGAEARCIVCHQGRESTATVNAYITTTKPTLATTPDTVDATASFRNIHYLAAGAVQYGTVVKAGYEYSGKTYDAKFAHVDGYDTCITCHDPHSLELKYDKCVTCHTGATDAAGAKNIRMNGSLEDYDGDGNTTEGMYAEVEGVKAKLYTAIRQYAVTRTPAKPIGYSATVYPYWIIDTNGDGSIDPVTETSAYNAFTARLLKATFNYQFATKDPGSYAHGGKYVIELMYDSIEDLNAGILAINPAAVLAVDITKLTRTDEGHFDGSAAAWRHWDAAGGAGVIPGGTTGCVKCHAGEGIPFFLTNGINIADTQSNGMMCVNCHSTITDGVAPHTAPRYVVGNVVFPSGLTAGFGAGQDSNLCILCHQGRESTVSINAKIAAAAPGSTTLSFTNSHYLSAGATLFGTQAKTAYEYAARTYTGQNPYNSHGGLFNKCVQCHMGSDSPTGNTSHNVAKVDQVNCLCHWGDVSQTPGAFDFANIRPGLGVSTTDFDGDSNVTESLSSEIAGLQAQLLTAIQAYAAGAPISRRIAYSAAAYPYWYFDANANNVVDGGEVAFGNHFDAKLLKACYNYNYSQKEPNCFIHSPLYIAQILHDSIRDLTGAGDAAWRATAAY